MKRGICYAAAIPLCALAIATSLHSAPQSGTQHFVSKGCGKSFDLPVVGEPWSMKGDSPYSCDVKFEAVTGKDLLGPIKLTVAVKPQDDTCQAGHNRRATGPFSGETASPSFLPADYYPRTTRSLGSKMVNGEYHDACFDLPKGSVKVTIGYWAYKEITPAEYSTMRTILTNVANSMRGMSPAGSSSATSSPSATSVPAPSKPATSSPATPAPAPARTATPAPAPASVSRTSAPASSAPAVAPARSPGPSATAPGSSPSPAPPMTTSAPAKAASAPSAPAPAPSPVMPPLAVPRLGLPEFLSYPSGLTLPISLCRGVFMPDQKSLLVGGWDGYVAVWELGIAREVRTVVPRESGGEDCVWHTSPDRRWLVYAREKGVDVWDTSTSQKIRTVETKDSPDAVFVSPNGKWIILAVRGEPALVMVEVKTGLQEARFQRAKKGKLGLGIPSGNLFAVNRDGAVVLWDLNLGREVKRIKVEEGGGNSAFSPDGRWLAVAKSWSTTGVQLIDMAVGSVVREFKAAENITEGVEINFLFFSPDGRHLYVAYDEILEDTSGVHVFDVATGRLLGGLPHEAALIDFSKDGRTVLLTTTAGTLQLYSLRR
jgi:hypothetical protein